MKIETTSARDARQFSWYATSPAGLRTVPLWVAAAIAGLFLVVHSPYDATYRLTYRAVEFGRSSLPGLLRMAGDEATAELAKDINKYYIRPLRGCVFFCCTLALFYCLGRDLRIGWPLVPGLQGAARRREALLMSLGAMAVLSILCIPIAGAWLSGSMGIYYAQLSFDPFLEPAGWYHRRLLKPALAFFLQLRGPLLYYLFGWAISGALLALTYGFLFAGNRSNAEPDNRPAFSWPSRFLLFASMCTASFVFHAWEFPGYPDHLCFLLLLFDATWPLGSAARLSLLAFALASHEAVLFPLVPIICFWYPRGMRKPALTVLGGYVLLWLLFHGLDPRDLIQSQAVVSGRPAWEFAAAAPRSLVWGTIEAYKLLWLLPAVAWLTLGRESNTQTQFRDVCIASMVILSCGAMLVFAVDVSRLWGFGFLGVVYLLKVLLVRLNSSAAQRALVSVAVVNLLLPSFYIGTNDGLFPRPGLYHSAYRRLEHALDLQPPFPAEADGAATTFPVILRPGEPRDSKRR
jgi:hypothetical protein